MVVTALMGIIFQITAPIFSRFMDIFERSRSRSLLKDRNRVFGAIDNYLASARWERVYVLDTKNLSIASMIKNLNSMISKDGTGDGLYIEIEAPCTVDGKIVMKNQVHIFRFYTAAGNQSFRYIPTQSGRMGNIFENIFLGREEVLMIDIKNGKFRLESDRVILSYTYRNREESIQFLRENLREKYR